MKRMITNAETLEHLIFKANDIEFNNGNVYKISESSEAKQLVEHIKYCYDNQVPLIIYEYNSDTVWIATNFGDINEVYLSNLNNHTNTITGITYDNQDTVSISVEKEQLMSEDNVKTLFGNQSIIGTGNIDLYRHDLEANNVHFTIYSSSNLKVDSPQDLTTVLKASVDVEIPAIFSVNNNTIAAEVWFKNKVWYTKCEGEDVEAITTVKDTVTTI